MYDAQEAAEENDVVPPGLAWLRAPWTINIPALTGLKRSQKVRGRSAMALPLGC
jgi:hypothetical protein